MFYLENMTSMKSKTVITIENNVAMYSGDSKIEFSSFSTLKNSALGHWSQEAQFCQDFSPK